MAARKKGLHLSRSKRVSKRVNDSIIGSHVQRSSTSASFKHAKNSENSSSNITQVEFSNGHRASKAQQGYVDHVGVASSSGEDDSTYSRRIAQPGYIQEIQRKTRRRRVLIAVLLIVVVLLIALAVGIAAYFASSNSKLEGGIGDAREALVAAEVGQPYYVLCAAELESAGSAQGACTDAYLLARVDEEKRSVVFVVIPANLSVRLSDGAEHPLYEAVEIGGQSELVEQVASFVDVDISHFVWTDATRLADMVDMLGGIELTVNDEVDDPYAGTKVLHTGEQTLTGETSLLFLRATNFQAGFETTANNRVNFTSSLIRTALESTGLSFAALVGDAGDYLSTDLTSAQLLALGDAFHDFNDVSVYTYVVPGSESASSNLYNVSTSEWELIAQAIRQGDDPDTLETAVANVVPNQISIEVLNGADIAGAAANMAAILEAAGYVVANVGNVTDATIYPETFVIYHDEAYESAAKAIIETIGGGRVVNGGDYYTFDTNILVIIGQDWIPVA